MRGLWPTEFKPKTGTIFSWVMNNYWGTNFPAWQGGSYTFRYIVSSAPTLDPDSLARSGQEAVTPLESAQMPASLESSQLPSDHASLLTIDNDSVLLTTWKLAENGHGSIIRLVETAGKEQKVSVKSDYIQFRQAWRCSLLEDNESDIAVQDGALSLTMRPFEILTLRLETTPKIAVQAAAE